MADQNFNKQDKGFRKERIVFYCYNSYSNIRKTVMNLDCLFDKHPTIPIYFNPAYIFGRLGETFLSCIFIENLTQAFTYWDSSPFH